MTSILVIAEHANGKLNPSTAKSVKAAASLPDAQVTVAVFTSGGSPVAAQAAYRVVHLDKGRIVTESSHA